MWRMQWSVVCVSLAIMGWFPEDTQGAGIMIDPAARGTYNLWQINRSAKKNQYVDKLDCGRTQNLPNIDEVTCGVCGDPVGSNRNHEVGGIFSNGVIAKTYREGETIQVSTKVDGIKGGWFEFRLCKPESPDEPDTQDCYNQHLLQQPNGDTRFELQRQSRQQRIVVAVTLKLPEDISCDACRMQWRWHTAQEWGRDATGSGPGKGKQPEFYNCADIRIEEKVKDSNEQEREDDDREERERLEREERDRLERERREREEREEQERQERARQEREERERQEREQQEKEEKERQERERQEREEQERQEREQQEREEREKQERERQEREEQERQEREQQEREERERQERERQEREEQDRQRRAQQEREERERLEQEQQEREEQERQAQERREREEREKQEREQQEREERERQEHERQEKEEKERQEREQHEREEGDRQEPERQEGEREDNRVDNNEDILKLRHEGKVVTCKSHADHKSHDMDRWCSFSCSLERPRCPSNACTCRVETCSFYVAKDPGDEAKNLLCQITCKESEGECAAMECECESRQMSCQGLGSLEGVTHAEDYCKATCWDGDCPPECQCS